MIEGGTYPPHCPPLFPISSTVVRQKQSCKNQGEDMITAAAAASIRFVVLQRPHLSGMNFHPSLRKGKSLSQRVLAWAQVKLTTDSPKIIRHWRGICGIEAVFVRNAHLSLWEFRPQALRWRAPSMLAGSESWLNQTPTTSGLGRSVDSKRGHFNGRVATMSLRPGAAVLQCNTVYAFQPLMIGSPRKATEGQTSTAVAPYRAAVSMALSQSFAILLVPDHCRREFLETLSEIEWARANF
jgi:hypothetical protein